jgi:hypothetical protein
MNLAEVARYEKMIAGANASTVKKWVNELKMRASGLHSRYHGDLSQFRYANEEQEPDIGLIGTTIPFSVTLDIENGYQFRSEYKTFGDLLMEIGYTENIKTAESIDPAAISNLMTMTIQKRKDLEDRTMQLLGSVNTVLKSIIAITYELKELDRNLSFYNLLESSDKSKKDTADLALKRIFVDNVDARKGGASLGSLSRTYEKGQGGAGFIDLLATFYAVKSLKDAEILEKNKMYRDIIRQRFLEYEDWKKINGSDLKNRREMLLQYLRSQFASFNMYKGWAAQSLTLLKRINISGIKNASDYMKSARKPDIFEAAIFSVETMAYKKLLLRNFDVEYKKVFGKKGPEIPVKIVAKSYAGPLMTKGPREQTRFFIHQKLRKLGPEVVPAIEASFAFTEKQVFPKGVPQERPQYGGSLKVKIKPYCFTLDEWYLFQKATEAYINKTVFEDVDAVSGSSLAAIQKDLDKYIKEAESRDKKAEKKPSQFAILEIIQAFRDDLFGINKALSSFGEGMGRREAFNPELYEIEASHRMFGRLRTHDAVAVGLFAANSDAALVYEGFKNYKKLLNPIDKFDNPFF